ncbi:MAG: c-type cytochrome [Pseudomonadota bacterium]
MTQRGAAIPLVKVMPMLCVLIAACASEPAQPLNEKPVEPFRYTITHQILGQAAYAEHCVSCHGRDLEGAAGVNLVDSVWRHGETVDEIAQNIAVGFTEGGMPGFAELLSEKDIDSLARYILSKREGWDTVSYNIYSVEEDSLPDLTIFESASPVVTGQFKNGIADFERIEIPFYAVELEGDFNVPWDEDIGLLIEAAGWTNANNKTQLRVEVNGEILEPLDKAAWDWMYPIEAGLQKLSISYYVSGPITQGEDWTMWHRGSGRVFIARRDGSAKLTPISRKAKLEMEDSAVNLEVKDLPSVVRIKTLDLPVYSINVGLTNNISYAFNTRSCDIVAVWYGEYLNVGPNIIGRGKEASEALGEWVFRYPDALSIASEPAGTECNFEKYTRGDAPAFYFQKDEVKYRLKGFSEGNGLRLEIGVKGLAGDVPTNFGIPEMNGFEAQTVGSSFSDEDEYPLIHTLLLEKK